MVGDSLRRLGYFLHKSPSGKLIVKMSTSRLPKLGSKVFDSRGRYLGRVQDVIGPVKSPYLVVKPRNPSTSLNRFEEVFTR